MDPWINVNLLLHLLMLLLLSKDTCQSPHARRLLRTLLADYEPLERPVANESDTVVVNFGLTMQQVIDVDERNQIITTNIWLNMDWNDVNLIWNPADYGGIDNLRLAPDIIWRPDVLMYNSADTKFDGTYHSNIVLSSDGNCSYIPPGIFKSTCKINIAWFPFDEQRCIMKFGSWTYDGYRVDLQLLMDQGDTDSFIENGEWDLIEIPGKRSVLKYACCPEPYPDVTFTVVIRRRVLYYLFNLLIPCFLISGMTLLVFVLPPESGEKLTLCVTLLLSLMVFLLLVAETMPATSDAVPLIGKYFACIMLMCALSVMFSVISLNMHHRTPDTYQMPNWMRIVFLRWLPKLLRMRSPAGTEKNLQRNVVNSKLKEIELKERCSRSLLANVLDCDDDFHAGNSMSMFANKNGSACDDGHVAQTSPHGGAPSELSLILKELRTITRFMQRDDDERHMNNEWHFLAMVVDRLCLYVFSIYTLVAIITVLVRAPNLL
ncbi:PREDICTED: neuronal acetylcholine receptor subunit alpha-7-like [Priapulus caudatus]|uniref:Neuronal acetylcholine receptor subunit alpha-7-like n=1 Tax=Priapulus caudatus TaxID=37621 RepID=A0ABM1E6E5_PRICU|nr:PREDICTED: neuronal acetylcholine receptor subunit alpha-7-like [Priapulus caudatus]